MRFFDATRRASARLRWQAVGFAIITRSLSLPLPR